MDNLNAVNWPLTTLSGLFLFLRIHLKRRQHHGLWWDDHMLILSWVALVVQSVLWAIMIQMRSGPRMSPDTMNEFLLILEVASTMLIVASIWSKVSFALTLLRLPMGWLKIFIWYLIISLTIIIGATTLIIWYSCTPNNLRRTGGFCLSNDIGTPYLVFSGAYAGLVDMTLALLPWKVLWGLQVKTGEKVGLALAMSMGIFAGLSSIVKATKYPLVKAGDQTAGTQVVIWGVIETALSIMAASLPILRALFKRQSAIPEGYIGDTTGGVSLGPRKPWRSEVSQMSRASDVPADAKVLSALGIRTQKWGENRPYEMTDYDNGVEVRPVETV